MDSFVDIVEAILTDWRKSGVRLLPPRPRDQVIEALLGTGRLISQDVIQLYSLTGGMVGESDSRLFSLWDLNLVVEENRSYSGTGLLFADFLINSHCYCLNYETVDCSSVAIDHGSGQAPTVVANTVADFFALLLNDPSRAGVMPADD